MAHCVALPGFVEDTLVIRRYAIERLFARITVESYQRARARRITLFARAYQRRIQKFSKERTEEIAARAHPSPPPPLPPMPSVRKIICVQPSS